jgi:hypothetical protein
MLERRCFEKRGLYFCTSKCCHVRNFYFSHKQWKNNQECVAIFRPLSIILPIKSGTDFEKVNIIPLKKHSCHVSNKDRYKLLHEVRKDNVDVIIGNTRKSQ